ncbi:CaiB/BaiF CoA transferase family protein [Peribacillus sp. SCS-155]|uniref:CaiB/BaiF CoA transferase family protein n=1 Tax=Peribacillus sedimenti TaxID=3115297 RepID=UPI0039062463
MSLLKGLKILDFSTLLPGPYATMMLGDLGAEVLRVESHIRKDLLRTFPPIVGTQSAAHQQLNRNKKSISLDLKQTEAVNIIKELIMEYDIVLEQFRPGVMNRLGLGYEDLKSVNPNIIYCSLTGYGQTGPYRDTPGHDNNYLSISGIMGISGRKESGPTLFGTQVADIAGGSLHSIIGILSAVVYRNNTGKGQYIDISMTDSCFSMNSMLGAGYIAIGQMEPLSEGTQLTGGNLYDFYRTRDGRYLSVGSLEPKFRKSLCDAIGRPDLFPMACSPDGSEEHAQFKSILKDIFVTRDFSEWCHIFHQFEACVEPVLSFAEACEHPQLQAREMIVEIPDGRGGMQKQIATPIKGSAFSPVLSHIGSEIGQDTDHILINMGFSETKIKELRDKKTIF